MHTPEAKPASYPIIQLHVSTQRIVDRRYPTHEVLIDYIYIHIFYIRYINIYIVFVYTLARASVMRSHKTRQNLLTSMPEAKQQRTPMGVYKTK